MLLPQNLSLFTCFYSSIFAYDSSGLNTDDIDRQIPLPMWCSPCNGHAERFTGVFSDTYHLLMTSDRRMEGLKTEKQTAHLFTNGLVFPTHRNYQNHKYMMVVLGLRERCVENPCFAPHPQSYIIPNSIDWLRNFTFQTGPVKRKEKQVGDHWRNIQHTKGTIPKIFQVTDLFPLVGVNIS